MMWTLLMDPTVIASCVAGAIGVGSASMAGYVSKRLRADEEVNPTSIEGWRRLVSELRRRIDVLEGRVSQQDDELRSLQGEVDNCERKSSAQRVEIATLKGQVGALQRRNGTT